MENKDFDYDEFLLENAGKDSDCIFLGDSIVPQTTIKELKELLKEKTDDATFADVYCRVWNHFFYYDPAGAYPCAKLGDPDVLPKKEWKRWGYFYDELFRELKKRMEKSGIIETYEKCSVVGHSFVKKYGYEDGDGWWWKSKNVTA